MAYMDTHYGHQGGILDVDAYSKDRVISCGLDRQVVFYKITEDSELLYSSKGNSVDTINVINHQFFVTGSADNALDLWILSRKKPIFSL